MKKINVVIVEDELLISNSLKLILNMTEDIEIVATAMNGKEALPVIEKHAPDVILMDVNMPVMDGIEATIKVKEKWPTVKVIMLTTLQARDKVFKAIQAGAEGYILKAIDPMDLAAAIRLVHRGETMITQEVAKMLFSGDFQTVTYREAIDVLTSREQEILKCISAGLTNAGIAQKLFLSEGTVRNYISSIYSKLEVNSRVEAIRKAKEML